MKRTIQVRISRGERQFVAECLDLPVVTQGPTLDELAANIQEAISLHLEGEDLAALGLADKPTINLVLELPLQRGEEPLTIQQWLDRTKHLEPIPSIKPAAELIRESR